MSDEYEGRDPDQERFRPNRPDDVPAPRPAPRRPSDDYADEPVRSSGGGVAKKVIIILSLVAVLGLCGVGSCIGLLFWATDRVRTAAVAAKETNNYKQIVLGMHNYESANGHLPPVSLKTKNGKPGLSWRVSLLPYLEQDILYRQFKLDEAWDHPANRKLAEKMPAIFARANEMGTEMTRVRLIVGKGAIYQTDRVLGLGEITDGVSNTFLFVEAAQPVLWIQPDELKFDPSQPPPALGSPDRDFFIAAMADGAVHRIRKSTPPEQIKAAITATGNEPVNLEFK
jgi:hypothetical protein